MSENPNWKARAVILGGIVGAALGVVAGFLYVRMAEESGGPRKLSTGKAVKLAMAALGVVRQTAQLGS